MKQSILKHGDDLGFVLGRCYKDVACSISNKEMQDEST